MARIPRVFNENVLVGFDTADDAGVYRLTPELALVQTVDFFTPIVDDPFTFGAIAAANSLSDVYAMGGKPITALSVLAYPGKGDLDDLSAILQGGSEKMREAGCTILGGHSVNDDEIKFGYSVTGTIHPERVKTNSGALPGDVLLLTKRIGTGVIGTAVKRGLASPEHVNAAVESMLTLNRAACDAMLDFDVHACTDVTGFGLLGHAREMALGSRVTIEILTDGIEYLPGAVDFVEAGVVPGGLRHNRDFVSCEVEGEGGDLLYDPQTSGGLLISLPESQAASLERALPQARVVGRVVERGPKAIRLL